MSTAIPSIRFDTADWPEDQRFAVWAHAILAYDVSRPAEQASTPFSASATAWSLGDIVVTAGHLDPVRFTRTAKKAESDGNDIFSLLLLTSGHWIGRIAGEDVSVGPGQVVAFDLTKPTDATGSENDNVTLGIARALIERHLPGPADVHGRVIEGAAGRMVVDHLVSLVRHLPALTVSDIPAVTQATAALLAHCFSTLPERARIPIDDIASTVLRVKRHVDGQLASPDLTPERICEHLAISRSSLYRAFAPLGGVAMYIQGRRLEAAHTALAQVGRRQSVAAVAYRFGFSSDAHFNKAFRRRFGYSPGETADVAGRAREAFDQSHGGSDGTSQFRDWMERLVRR